jgi:hypothetical protein
MTRQFDILWLALALGLAACGSEASESPVGPRGWQTLPASPLSARHAAHAFWTGSEVLVLGGSDAEPCPPNADCPPPDEPPLSDGAAFDPAAVSWRPIAPAPVPLGYATGAVVDRVLYLWVPAVDRPGAEPAFLAYGVTDDRWTTLEPPPGGAEATRVTAMGSRLLAYHGSQEGQVFADLVFDPAAGAWFDLVGDPIAPAYDRSAVWTGRELVVLGIRLDPSRPANAPPVYSAAAFDPPSESWRRLPDSEVAGYNPAWLWAGGSIVNASIGSADGGEINNWGRAFPFGGVLTPPAGEWSSLPDPPGRQGAYAGLSAGGGEHVVADGWALHVPTGRWTELTRPLNSADGGEAVAWAGDRLVVWGGIRWIDDDPVLLDSGWSWVP